MAWQGESIKRHKETLGDSNTFYLVCDEDSIETVNSFQMIYLKYESSWYVCNLSTKLLKHQQERMGMFWVW